MFTIQIIIITTIKIFKQSLRVQIIQNKHRLTTVNFVQTQFNPTFPPPNFHQLFLNLFTEAENYGEQSHKG